MYVIEKYYKSFKLINKSITNDFDNIVITIICKLLITFKILDNIMLIKLEDRNIPGIILSH